MSHRIGLVGLDSSHAEDFLRHINIEARHAQMRITALYGTDDARLAGLQRVDGSLVPYPTLGSLIENVDAVIVGHRDGALHRDAAIACLKAGRPVFVDKPLANSRRDAEAMVAAAEQSGVPLLSGSALRWQAETRRIRARLAGMDGSIELHAWGTWYPESAYGGAIFYAIHTIELVQELLGPQFREVSLRNEDPPVIACRIAGNEATLSFRPLGPSGHSDFGVEVAAKGVHFRQPIMLGDDYMLPVVDRFAAMLRTGVAPMTRDELIAPLRLMEAIDTLLAPRS